MIAVERTALVLLAAGRSSRFPGGKLAQDYRGRPVGLHVAVALEAMPFLDRIAVVGGDALDYTAHGFRKILNPDPDAGMSHSVRLGVAAADALGANAMLIVLADMPCVTAAHIAQLFDASESETVVASSDGGSAKPPALFPRAQFAALMGLTGDHGARALIRAAHRIVATPAELIDIDTPADLDRLRGRSSGYSSSRIT